MTYRSKKDSWLVAVIFASGAMTLAAGTMSLARGGLVDVVLGLVVVSVYLGATLCFLPPIDVLEDHVLVIRTGLRRWRIPIRDIIDVQPTRDAAASPALSLDRLRITYTNDGKTSVVLISPEDRDAFQNALTRRRV